MGTGAAIGSYIGANYTKKVSINTFLLIQENISGVLHSRLNEPLQILPNKTVFS